MKLATEAPVNGGRNYDGPKVEFFCPPGLATDQVCTSLYAGTSEYPTVLVKLSSESFESSENPFGADNQQETI